MIAHAKTNDEKMALIAYLASKVGITPAEMIGSMPFDVAAVVRAGRPIGAVLYTNFRGNSIEMTWAGEAGWLTRENLRAIFNYPFEQLGCLVAFASVDLSNSKAIDLLEKLGCKRGAVIPHLYGRNKDGAFYCMAYDKCKWLDRPTSRRDEFSMNGAAHYG